MRYALLLLAALLAHAPDMGNKGEPIMVHVKEVNRIQNEDPTAEGNWFHLTAVVETKTIVYSLRCDEFYSTPNHKFSPNCFRLSAGKDYPALKFQTAISFWSPTEKRDYPAILYEIVSEKEK